jgi:hypothetical protein
MARRRGTEKPVETLRSSWTSNADLEETLASMFHREETVPGDKLAPQSPDKLAPTPPAKLAGTPVKLTGVPADNMAGLLYRTMDGLVVDAKCIRPFEAAQNGHTHSEHLVYTTMWRMLGGAGATTDSREGILPMRQIAGRASLSVRNLRRVLHSLVEKLAVDVTEYEDKTKSIPRRYRVWGPRAVVERRRRAGYTHVYRSRNLITLAAPRDNLSGTDQSS